MATITEACKSIFNFLIKDFGFVLVETDDEFGFVNAEAANDAGRPHFTGGSVCYANKYSAILVSALDPGNGAQVHLAPFRGDMDGPRRPSLMEFDRGCCLNVLLRLRGKARIFGELGESAVATLERMAAALKEHVMDSLATKESVTTFSERIDEYYATVNVDPEDYDKPTL